MKKIQNKHFEKYSKKEKEKLNYIFNQLAGSIDDKINERKETTNHDETFIIMSVMFDMLSIFTEQIQFIKNKGLDTEFLRYTKTDLSKLN